MAGGTLVGLGSWHWQHLLQDLVAGKGEAELRRLPENTSWSTLEKCSHAFLVEYPRGTVPDVLVFRLTLPCLYLQSSFDDIAWRGEVGRRHTSNGTCCQKLENT